MTALDARRGRRIVILCEGDTEELAIRHFVTRQWRADGLAAVALHPVSVNGKMKDVVVKARLYLDEQEVLGVCALVDLYGFDQVTHSASDDLDTKVRRVRDWLRNSLTHERSADFFPHIGVHETEAWLLAEGAALAKRLGDPGIQPDPHAELKNFQKPPKKRLNDLFLRNRSDRYQEIRDGRPLFAEVHFAPVYQHCRYFRSFYDELRSFGRK